MKKISSKLLALLIVLCMIIPSGLVIYAQDNPNLALNKTATSSANETAELSPDKAVDGNTTARASRWASGSVRSNPPQWLSIDLGSVQTIRQINLYWEASCGTDYTIQTSDDGNAWADIFTVTNGTLGEHKKTILFNQDHQTKHVRVNITKEGGVWASVSLFEVEVFAKEVGKSPLDILNEAEAPTISPDGKTLVFPAVPIAGYEFGVFGSDNKVVIDLDGNVRKPLVSTTVNLILTLKSTNDGEDLVAEKNIVVAVDGIKDTNTGNAEPIVIPSLREWDGASGDLVLTDTARIVVAPENKTILQKTAEIAATDYKDVTGRDIEVVYDTPEDGDIYLTLDDSTAFLGYEGYELTIGDFISIKGSATTGVFFGTRTILQILKADPTHTNLPKGLSRDYPKYEQRGFSFDVARKYIPITFVRDYVKLMSWYKMNTFMIHLNDNAFSSYYGNDWNKTYDGFRIESETYPGLASADGHYTKDEFRELQYMGLDYGVEVIPEIDTPAHSLSLVKYDPSIGDPKYGLDHLDILNPDAYTFVENLFTEYMSGDDPVFINKVNIGTDEYSNATVALREAFRKYTADLLDLVRSYDKKPYLWGALSHAPGTTPVNPKDATMLCWYNGYMDPREAIKQGFDVISISDGLSYIVPAAGYYYDYLNSNNIYNTWEPNIIASSTFPKGHPQIKGGAFAVWNDIAGNGISVDDIHDRVFAAIQTLGEKMWRGTRTDVTYATFAAKINQIGESPGTNLSAKLLDVPQNEVLNMNFNSIKNNSDYNVDLTSENVSIVKDDIKGSVVKFEGGSSFIETSVLDVGFGWTVSMDINPDLDNPEESILLESDRGVVKLNQGEKNIISFSKENYTHFFAYEVPNDEWTTITLTGNAKGTSLYVNGEFVERLEGVGIPGLTNAANRRYVQTLILPLNYIGSKTNAFKGLMDNVKVFNKVCSDAEIEKFTGKIISETNVALGKVATASSNEVAKFSPDKAVDGNRTDSDSRWASGYSDNNWFKVDLGENFDISKVAIYWESSYGTEYKILVSDDDVTYNEIFHKTNATGGINTLNFDTISARYVQFQGISRSSSYGYSFYEFEVYVVANKTNLINLIESVDELSEIEYTVESWSSLVEELNKAIEIQNNATATQKEVDDIYTSLNAAYEALEKKLQSYEVEHLFLDKETSLNAGDSYRISTTFKNNTNINKNATFIVALYLPNGKMYFMDAKQLILEPGDTPEIDLSITMPETITPNMGLTVKVFAWDSVSFEPIVEAVTNTIIN